MSATKFALSDLMTPERLQRGYVVVLPGIEGESFLNRNVVKGLLRAQVPYAIEIHDWTYGVIGYLWNLRSRRRHRQQAEIIAGKIANYREQYPTQPVYLIGHSGGGAMTVFTLEHLPADSRVTGGLMLVPAISEGYDLSPALHHTERGLWSFSSFGDVFMLGLGMLVLGTCDGKHCLSAGMRGFDAADSNVSSDSEETGARFHEVRYRQEFARTWNLGGHFGPTHPKFVQHWLAPILLGGDVPLNASAREPSRNVESLGEALLPVR